MSERAPKEKRSLFVADQITHEQQLFVEADIRSECTYCGLQKARLVVQENRAGFLEVQQWGAICPHLELVLHGYRQSDAIARGIRTR